MMHLMSLPPRQVVRMVDPDEETNLRTGLVSVAQQRTLRIVATNAAIDAAINTARHQTAAGVTRRRTNARARRRNSMEEIAARLPQAMDPVEVLRLCASGYSVKAARTRECLFSSKGGHAERRAKAEARCRRAALDFVDGPGTHLRHDGAAGHVSSDSDSDSADQGVEAYARSRVQRRRRVRNTRHRAGAAASGGGASTPISLHFVQVVCGERHSVGRMEDGRLALFGDNTHGQLGHGQGEVSLLPRLLSIEADELQTHGGTDPAASVAVADSKADVGGFMLRGGVAEDQSGDGGGGGGGSAGPGAAVMMRLKVINVDCGASHTMAVTSAGSLWSWGLNDHGQLGLGDTQSRCGSRRRVVCRVARAAEPPAVQPSARPSRTPPPAPSSRPRRPPPPRAALPC